MDSDLDVEGNEDMSGVSESLGWYQGCWGNNVSKRIEVEISIEYMHILKKH